MLMGLFAFRIMPSYVRNMVKKREVLATVVLLLPMSRTMFAMESDGMAGIEKWLRFWASCAPIMIVLDFPIIMYSIRWFVPWWPELLILYTLWLNSSLTRGSNLIIEIATPLVARAMTHLNETTGLTSTLLRKSVRQTLQIGVVVMRLRSARAAQALQQVLDNMSIPLVMCTVFFFTPGLITIYGCDMAGLVVPFAYTIDGLNKYHQFKAQLTNPARKEARKEAEKRHEGKLRNMLTYWLAHAMIWSLSQELSKSGLSWFPLWRHSQLAGIYWLQVFGGARRITERMRSIKESIVQDHQQALKAAISADLDASKAESELLNNTKMSHDENKVQDENERENKHTSTHEILADGKSTTIPSKAEKIEIGISVDGLRKRNSTPDSKKSATDSEK
jgi:hypothetical protein